MKKLIVLILCLVLTLVLASCEDSQGPQGEQGLPGEKGDKGDPGEKGDKGDTGAAGIDGKTPYIGENGNWWIGETDTGVKAEGVDGAQGIPGEKGDKGDTGAQGAQGIPGEKGDKGDTGAQGAQGVTGATIKEITFDDQGRMIITLTDGTVLEPIEMPEKEEHVHSFGAWVDYGNDNVRLQFAICGECKEIVWQVGACRAHTFDTVTTAPTCKEQGYDTSTCRICNTVEVTNYTDTVDHSFETTYSYNNSFHWFACEYCDTTRDCAEHTVDESGYCTVCDQPLKPTEGIVYSLSADGTYAEVIGYEGDATRIVIADVYKDVPVRIIYDEAFYDNSNITSVVIPDSVTRISGYAFGFCESLTSVIIPDSVTSIGGCAFYKCSELTSVIIPDSVTSIGSYAFSYCSSLTSITIPDRVTSISDYAFYNCSRLASVIISDGVTSISFCAFENCYSLASVIIPDSVTTIGAAAFENCSSLTSVIIGSGVMSIGSDAFYNCNSALYTVYEYGRYVGDAENPYAVLIGMTNNKFDTYTIHDGTKVIGGDAFYNCSRLTSVTIPDGVRGISEGAFESCSNLKSLTIPDGVMRISYEAFKSCSSLTSLTIPDSVMLISFAAFESCSSLKTVYYAGTAEEWSSIVIDNTFSNNSKLINATRYYYSESEPTSSGNFWHYVDGVPTKW